MKVFADLYLDEDVSVLVATLLRARGFDTVTAVETGMLGQDDVAQLMRASAAERCLVTHNRVHFERLHREFTEAGQNHSGIIVAVRRIPYELARGVAVIINVLTADELSNQPLYC